jgi:DNA repair exonuclease SbcCD ATPase subunit
MGALKVAGSCSLCGKDVSEVPEVVAKNEEIDLNIAEATKEAATLAAKISQGLKDEVELMAIKTASKAALAAAAKYGAHLTVNADVMPPTLTWAGPTDFEVVKGALADAESKLAKLEETVSAYDKAAARKEEAEKRVNAAKADLQHAVDQLAGRKPVSTGAAQMLVQTAEATVAGDRSLLDAARATLEAARSYRREAVAAWESHLKLMAQIEGTIAQRQAELKTLQFNNTLLKAVRTARPVIADKLWSLVLGAVSRYFSEMRGERSLVTKTTDGFVVDGHSAATLSGSTLDILGLAVRVALVRTFVPHAPLLVLDEPTAAMDAERTATTLGFLAATGFKQTIIVSHEEATEAVADHLIQL